MFCFKSARFMCRAIFSFSIVIGFCSIASPEAQAQSAQRRAQIRAMPILERPNRPLHFYGNAVRRNAGVVAMPGTLPPKTVTSDGRTIMLESKPVTSSLPLVERTVFVPAALWDIDAFRPGFVEPTMARGVLGPVKPNAALGLESSRRFFLQK